MKPARSPSPGALVVVVLGALVVVVLGSLVLVVVVLVLLVVLEELEVLLVDEVLEEEVFGAVVEAGGVVASSEPVPFGLVRRYASATTPSTARATRMGTSGERRRGPRSSGPRGSP